MGEVHYWERRFIEDFVVPKRRDRYLQFLGSKKNRHKALDRLNHTLDFDRERARLIPGAMRTTNGLLTLLKEYNVRDTCHVLADDAEEDGAEMRLEAAVDFLVGHPWGVVLICPPAPVAIYKEEDIGDMYLLGGSNVSSKALKIK
jgi:hypothetical protein